MEANAGTISSFHFSSSAVPNAMLLTSFQVVTPLQMLNHRFPARRYSVIFASSARASANAFPARLLRRTDTFERVDDRRRRLHEAVLRDRVLEDRAQLANLLRVGDQLRVDLVDDRVEHRRRQQLVADALDLARPCDR